MMYVLNAEENRETNTEIKTGWERGELKRTYYTIDGESQPETYHPEDTERYDKADYFGSPTLAADIAQAQMIWRKLMRWQAENDTLVDWADTKTGKWYIYFNHFIGDMHAMYTRDLNGFNVYFTCKDKAEEAIKTFSNELIWFYTKFIYRLDSGAK